MDTLQTPRTRVKRVPARGVYDRETVYRILDEALICHVGLVADGQPFVLPTIHARMGENLVFHGAGGSRLLRYIAGGGELCVTVTLLDGLVLARSAFHHSMNYRSVVLLGAGRPIADPQEKLGALRAITEHLVPGRWDAVRPPNEVELKQTAVVAVPIDEASAKVRSGPPVDDEEDYRLPVWAGVIPLHLAPRNPEPDPRLRSATPVPGHLADFFRQRGIEAPE